MFDVRRLFGASAVNQLLQPFQTPGAQSNMLMAAAQPSSGAFVPAPAQTTAAPSDKLDPIQTGATPAEKSFGQRYQDFWNSDRGEYLGDMFAGWAMGGTPQESLGYGAKMGALGRATRKEKQTAKDQMTANAAWLQGQGYSPEEAKVIASDQGTLAAAIKQIQQTRDPAHQLDMRYRQAQIDKLNAEAAGGSGSTRFGLVPQYGVDDDGNPVLIQLGENGQGVQTALPPGVKLSKEPIRMDAGTHFILLDPITRQQVGMIPKQNEQEASDKAKGTVLGKAEGESIAGLEGAMSEARMSMALIDQMLQHPGRETATGASATWDPRNYMAGTDATNFNVMRKQLEGRAFLQAFESLKGGGQITEIEGQKATEAVARLSTAQSDEAYVQALNELKGVLQTGMQRAQRKAGVGAAAAQPEGDPAPTNYKSKYGLD